MFRRISAHRAAVMAIAAAGALAFAAAESGAQAAQKNDEEYTRLIRQFSRDPRFMTDLVDHLPASNTVPTPLKHFGAIMGAWNVLQKSNQMDKYLMAVAKAAPGRTRYINIGKTEEGRDMSVLIVANEETIRNLEKYKGYINALTDPRKTTEAQAQQIIKATGKPIYWLTSGMHSTERGGPHMLMELAYRLVVGENEMIQGIRKNVITMITPVVEPDGQEKMVDNWNFNRKRPAGEGTLPLMYWGKYVQHDNNRDGMGQMLALTKNIEKFGIEWKPTVLHDLHEAQTLLYASTGTGPYNDQLDAITTNEWWVLAQNDVIEMTKKNVPGVWTYNFYDGWTPNYMFFVAHGHNATGRFYEVQSYGPDTVNLNLNQSREWFRPNPAIGAVKWGPRENTNIQQSAVLFALNHMARNRDFWLENYWVKNKRAVDKGRNGPTFAWHIPAQQRRKADAAEAVNALMEQGLEFHTANADFKAGALDIKKGDYIIRGDQPFRTVADIYFAVQRYSTANPQPYDDTGWTFQYMRDLVITPVTNKSVLAGAMTELKGKVKAPGGLNGTGPVVIVEHTGDNNVAAFRYKLKDVKMAAAEDDFTVNGKTFRAGAIVIQGANAAQIDPVLKDLGLSAWAAATAPTVKTHDLDIPRILYLHSWNRTQDEGWVRASLEAYGIPFTYVGDKELAKMPNLKARYDVVIYPHVSGTAQSMVAGVTAPGTMPIPYKSTAEFPSLGFPDSTDDIRGGMG
ncbi:MAG: M14 family zinc carboxypeptidase, partial [Gemmatimonadota bacterium]|nr:M14 family zinc carboxypeptidase [Gemmatimonadota bacterium]